MNKPNLEQELNILGQVLGDHARNDEVKKTLTLMCNDILNDNSQLNKRLFAVKTSVNTFINKSDKSFLYNIHKEEIMKEYDINHDILYHHLYNHSKK